MPKTKSPQAWPEVTRPPRYGRPNPENVDMTPIEMPLGACRPTPLQDLIASMVRSHMQAESGDEFGTPEDEDDFYEDDPETLDMSPYEQLMVEPDDLPTAEALEPENPEIPPQELIEAAQRIVEASQKTGDPPDLDAVEPS